MISLPKLLGGISVLLFGLIGIAALFKSTSEPQKEEAFVTIEMPLEVESDQEIEPAARRVPHEEVSAAVQSQDSLDATHSQNFPEANRIDELFNKEDPRFSFVETITYKSRVPWQKGRPAWMSDYAVHYKTSCHFIARSLNGKPDYLKQNVNEGDRFNVFRLDKKIEFYLVVDISRCKMWFYCIDQDSHHATLLRTYQVGLGRLDPSKASGLLTPLGKYSLGNKTAVYQAATLGYHNGQKVQMRSVFGTRWVPFDKEMEKCTLPAKGFGLHGVPWIVNANGSQEEDRSSIGKYKSDGCIRMETPDIEELYAVIITRPTTIELVRDFSEAKLP